MTVFILSYIHSEKYSRFVPDFWPWEQDFIDVAVTTRERTGRGGSPSNLALQKAVCVPPALEHAPHSGVPPYLINRSRNLG